MAEENRSLFAAQDWGEEFVLSEGEMPPLLRAILPSKHVMPNNKMANVLTKLDIDEPTEIIVHKNATSTCVLTVPNEAMHDLFQKEGLSHYDRAVYDAVTTLYLYGDPEHLMTPAMIYRAMVGANSTEKPTQKQIDSVVSSLDKMRFVRIQVDCTEEMKKIPAAKKWEKKLKSGECRIIIDDYLLAAKSATVYAGGQEVKAYKIMDAPSLYDYSNAVKEVVTLPSSILDVKRLNKDGSVSNRSLPNSRQRVLIKTYLVRRIEGMKGKNGLSSRNISLNGYTRDGEYHEGIYDHAGFKNPSKTEASRVRSDVECMLDFWKATGYIKGYAPYKGNDKKTFAGYTIKI